MNPLDEAAKDSSAHMGPIPSARDDYALASPLQVVVDTQEGEQTFQYRWEMSKCVAFELCLHFETHVSPEQAASLHAQGTAKQVTVT